LETAVSYGAGFGDDWAAFFPASHWKFFEETVKFHETPTHIFVHACLDTDLDMRDQPDWLLFWEFFDRIKPHHSGKRVICGHTPKPFGLINVLEFATCIDTGPAKGGWLTCLDVNSGKNWQANQKGRHATARANGRVFAALCMASSTV
jgi:serine/threonine protein phosphatase 1